MINYYANLTATIAIYYSVLVIYLVIYLVGHPSHLDDPR